jgi:hypothetical protein
VCVAHVSDSFSMRIGYISPSSLPYISIYTVDSVFFLAIGRCDALGLVRFYSRSKGEWSRMRRIYGPFGSLEIIVIC